MGSRPAETFLLTLLIFHGSKIVTKRCARAGGRAVDLGGPKFEIKYISRCLQTSKLFDWGASLSIGGGQAPLGAGPALPNNYILLGDDQNSCSILRTLKYTTEVILKLYWKFNSNRGRLRSELALFESAATR